MASIIRIGRRFILTNNKKPFFSKNDNGFIRTITSKVIRDQDPDRIPKPKPWPYNDKRYTVFHQLFDRTTSRIDENSKIIVVEGPVAAGKSKLARELAKELDMLYMPEANQDMEFINSYGFDIRTLDEQLPERTRSFDVDNFLKTPKHINVASFQISQLTLKYSQYIDALAHLFSTGQGIVLDRCVYSDFVFAEVMYKFGYISKAAYKYYYEVRDSIIQEILRPHLVIYLDVPVKRVLENIKNRAYNCERNSPVLTTEYLTEMELKYKQKYLKEISKHAELLVYDWSEEGEAEVIVEDIERIPFVQSSPNDLKFSDWEFELEEDWAVVRHKYADDKEAIMCYTNIPAYHIPELILEAEDAEAYIHAYKNAPGQRYHPGFNRDMGDTGVLFKGKWHSRSTLPLRERRPL